MEMLSIPIDKDGIIYRQIYSYILNAIEEGSIPNGEKLPAVRVLASQLSVSRNTVETAYHMLEADELVEARFRDGYYVTAPHKDEKDFFKIIWERNIDYTYNLSANGTDISHINHGAFARCMKNSYYNNPQLFGYGEKRGELILREAIAKYLYVLRGISCAPDQIIIGSSENTLLAFFTNLFPNSLYAFENPGKKEPFDRVKNANRRVAAVRTDTEGVDTEALNSSGADIFYTMTAHQFPLGFYTGSEKRKEILDWANKKDGRYIIEYDYDGEFIYNNKDKGLIFAEDKNGKTVYMGGFSRSFAPSVKISYMVLPVDLVELWHEKNRFYRAAVSRFEQYGMAEFIENGGMSKHLKRMTGVYRHKRDKIEACFRNSAIGERVHISGDGAGLHFLLTLDSKRDKEELVRSAAKHGVKLLGVGAGFLDECGYEGKSFIIGFGALSDDEIEKSVALLEQAWGE